MNIKFGISTLQKNYQGHLEQLHMTKFLELEHIILIKNIPNLTLEELLLVILILISKIYFKILIFLVFCC